MKILLMFIFILSVSCDSPQRTRFKTTPAVSEDPIDVGSTGEDKDDAEKDKDKVIDDETTDEIVTNPGFEDCTLGYEYYAGSSIGHIGLCQSELNESTFKLKMASKDKTVGTCFIPIHILADGNSFKLGRAECVKNDKDKVYDMILSKESMEEINGVMVIKAGNPVNAYMQCMSAKTDYFLSRPSCQNDPNCVNSANQYAFDICTMFRNQYSAYYSQIPL